MKIKGYKSKVLAEREAARRAHLNSLDASFEEARQQAFNQKHFHGMMHNCCTALRN